MTDTAAPEWITASTPLWESLAEIRAIEAQIADLTAKRDAAVATLQSQCQHPLELVVDGKYENSAFGGVLHRPMRVCRLCGYGEEGWGAGYWKLPKNYSDVPELSHQEAWKFVRTFVWQSQMALLGRYGEENRKRALAGEAI